jgi:hypothetical protein
MKLELIHYGASKYDPSKIKPIKNARWIKPEGGLWASPQITNFGWKEWNEKERFTDISSCFKFNYSGNILIIDSENDLNKLHYYQCDPNFINLFTIDFEKLLIEYDAVFLTEKGQRETRYSSPKHLYGWDCESILIMNPKGIEI